MLELARYEGRRRLRGALVSVAVVSGFAAMYIATYPSIASSVENLDELLEAYPDAALDAFGVRSFATIEGFLASELYTFVWMLLIGLYFGYLGASVIAPDVEHGRLDVRLGLPVTRTRYLLESAGALLVPLAGLTAVVPVVVIAGGAAVGYPVDAVDVLALHLLSVPYFLACAGVGLVASVWFDRASVAQRVALGVLAGLFFAESVLADTDFGWVGTVAPSRYLDPNAVLLDGRYAVADAGVLLVGTAGLLAVATAVFRRRDVP